MSDDVAGGLAGALGGVGVGVWLACAYAAFLVAAAYGLDLMAKRIGARSANWTTGAFRYHADHDAWVCPEDQWLWPESFDPDNRVMRYRASPTVCNSCPVKHTCTTSRTGREVSRNVDPWPHSEAGRFHRGIACAITVLAVLVPLVTVVGRSAAETGVLLVTVVAAAAASWPLWQHLRNAPAGFPEHVPVRGLPVVGVTDGTRAASATGPAVAADDEVAPRDRFATRWGSFSSSDVASGEAGRSRMGSSS